MFGKRKYFLFILVLLFPFCKKFEYQTGDLIFQDLDCGEMCDAIENATIAYNNYDISHVGIISVEDSGIYVIEAYDSVEMTPLKVFLKRSNKILVGRLKPEYRNIIPNAIKKAKSLIGKPYDIYFKNGNDSFYCSEVVYESFVNQKGHLFDLFPMNFKNLETGKIDSVWIKYFDKMGKKVPQGELGSNPAAYSLTDKIEILYQQNM